MTVILPISKYVYFNSLSSKQLCGKKKKSLVESTAAQMFV